MKKPMDTQPQSSAHRARDSRMGGRFDPQEGPAPFPPAAKPRGSRSEAEGWGDPPRLVAVGGMLPASYRVTQRVRESMDVCTLCLRPDDPADAAPFAPGQFSMLYVLGVGEVPMSICSGARDGTSLVYTVRDVGPVTRALCQRRRGSRVGVRGPFGRGWPLAAAQGRDLLLVAGGIGMAPLRSVLDEVARQRSAYGRVSLLYGARTAAEALYAAELRRLGGLDVQVLLTVDKATPGWRGPVGLVTALLPQAQVARDRTLAMLCGPEIMMRVAAQALIAEGVAAQRVYVSLERNMRCAVGFCGHCLLGPHFICRDGPVLPVSGVAAFWEHEEL